LWVENEEWRTEDEDDEENVMLKMKKNVMKIENRR